MAQATDYSIVNATGSAVRSDLNSVLGAIATLNSGATAPSTMYAYMLWADTSTTKLMIRNGANSAWVEVGSLDQAGLNIVASKFPNVSSSVTLTHTQLNNTVYLVAGTKMIFFQSAPPIGWTQDTSHNDKALRVVSGTGGGDGGSTGFSSAFTHTHSDSFSAAGHALTESEMPKHYHRSISTFTSGTGRPHSYIQYSSSNDPNNASGGSADDRWSESSTSSTGGGASSGTRSFGSGNGSSHTHTMSGSITSATIAPHYIDVIVCSKS